MLLGLNKTALPKYCYFQINQAWQENACSRIGVNPIYGNNFQPGGPYVILARPDLNSFINVQGNKNLSFVYFHWTESWYMRIRSAILEYMLSIEHVLIDRDIKGHENYLYTLNYASVQD